jgi:hypothetical protein
MDEAEGGIGFVATNHGGLATGKPASQAQESRTGKLKYQAP